MHGIAERPIARLTFLSQFCFAPRASKRGAFEPRQNPPKATPGLFDSATGAAIAEDGMTSRRGGLRQPGVSKTDTLSPAMVGVVERIKYDCHAGVICMRVACNGVSRSGGMP